MARLTLPPLASASRDFGLDLKAAVQVRDSETYTSRTPGHAAALYRRFRGTGGRIIRPLLIFVCTACTRPPILSRATALMGDGFLVLMDVRPSMLSDYQPRRVAREGAKGKMVAPFILFIVLFFFFLPEKGNGKHRAKPIPKPICD